MTEPVPTTALMIGVRTANGAIVAVLREAAAYGLDTKPWHDRWPAIRDANRTHHSLNEALGEVLQEIASALSSKGHYAEVVDNHFLVWRGMTKAQVYPKGHTHDRTRIPPPRSP